jgi:hypothetical protein
LWAVLNQPFEITQPCKVQLVNGWEHVGHPKQILGFEVSWGRTHEHMLDHKSDWLTHMVLPFLQVIITG